MKNKVLVILIIMLTGFVLITCENGNNNTIYDCEHCQDEGCAQCGDPHDYGELCDDLDCKDCYPNPGDVFGVEFEHLAGKSIVINFPVGFDAEEEAALMIRLQNIITRLDTRAGTDAAFKTKVNALLGKGLTIVIEEEGDYGIKSVGSQLFIEIGFFAAGNNVIANAIISMINDGTLAKAKQSNRAGRRIGSCYPPGIALHSSVDEIINTA